MRDLLDKLNNVLSEAKLAAGEIPPNKLSGVINPKTNKPFTRPELFLHKVKTQSPFTLVDGGEQVVINPKEAKKVADWIAMGPAGTITLTTIDGIPVKNTQLQKTVEFGSKESELIGIKPSDVFQTTDIEVQDMGNSMESVLSAGGFPASEMYDKLVNNPELQKAGKVGEAVVYMAEQVNRGQVPEFPPGLKPGEIKAIELYASEYLGALGLVTGAVPFMRGSREEFEEFLGTSLSDMIMYFPKASNNPLADSFSVVNNDTGHAVKISSKAAGKGAPPSLGSMKLPEEVRTKYPEAAKFLDVAQDASLNQFTQPFAMMNYLYEVNPNKVPRAYHSLLPFSPELVSSLANSYKTGKSIPRKIMGHFEKQLSEKVLYGDATDGGKAWYAVTADVMRSVNSDRAIPELRAAIIESLGYNFVQLYTNAKGNKLITEAFWPAKISGNVKLKTKGSAGEIKGKMSVEISPGGEDLEQPAGLTKDQAQGGLIDVAGDEEPQGRLTGPGVKAARMAKQPNLDTSVTGRERRRR